MKRVFLSNIERAKTIAIFSHLSPDADALCGSFALKDIIKDNFEYKIVDVFSDGQIGRLYDDILRDKVINPLPLSRYDLAIVLDSTNIDRVGKYANMIRSIPRILNIDHHDTIEYFGTDNLIDPKASSTCEMLYILAENNGLIIDKTVAKSLYQGIITDTNNFTSRSTTSITRLVAQELRKFNFDFLAIKEHYFGEDSEAKKVLSELALNTIKYFCDDKLVTMQLSNDAFVVTNATFDDTLGIIDKGLEKSNAEVAGIFIESLPEHIYASLRGRGLIDLGAIAKNNGGGGSRTMAGYQVEGNIDEVEAKFVKDVEAEFNSDPEIDELHNGKG